MAFEAMKREVTCGMKFPIGHGMVPSGDDPLCLAVAERPQDQREVVVIKWSDQDETIETVQQAAMAWQQMAQVLDPDIALDGREQEITELAENADTRTQDQEHRQTVHRRPRKHDVMAENGHQGGGEHHRSDRSGPGFAGAGVGAASGRRIAAPCNRRRYR